MTTVTKIVDVADMDATIAAQDGYELLTVTPYAGTIENDAYYPTQAASVEWQVQQVLLVFRKIAQPDPQPVVVVNAEMMQPDTGALMQEMARHLRARGNTFT